MYACMPICLCVIHVHLNMSIKWCLPNKEKRKRIHLLQLNTYQCMPPEILCGLAKDDLQIFESVGTTCQNLEYHAGTKTS